VSVAARPREDPGWSPVPRDLLGSPPSEETPSRSSAPRPGIPPETRRGALHLGSRSRLGFDCSLLSNRTNGLFPFRGEHQRMGTVQEVGVERGKPKLRNNPQMCAAEQLTAVGPTKRIGRSFGPGRSCDLRIVLSVGRATELSLCAVRSRLPPRAYRPHSHQRSSMLGDRPWLAGPTRGRSTRVRPSGSRSGKGRSAVAIPHPLEPPECDEVRRNHRDLHRECHVRTFSRVASIEPDERPARLLAWRAGDAAGPGPRSRWLWNPARTTNPPYEATFDLNRRCQSSSFRPDRAPRSWWRRIEVPRPPPDVDLSFS